MLDIRKRGLEGSEGSEGSEGLEGEGKGELRLRDPSDTSRLFVCPCPGALSAYAEARSTISFGWN